MTEGAIPKCRTFDFWNGQKKLFRRAKRIVRACLRGSGGPHGGEVPQLDLVQNAIARSLSTHIDK